MLTPNVGECTDPPQPEFLRGDADGSCSLDISDGVFILGYLFLGEATPPCLDAADADDSGELDLSDGVFVLGFLFLGEEEPPSPGPDILGPDPTEDELIDCVSTVCEG